MKPLVYIVVLLFIGACGPSTEPKTESSEKTDMISDTIPAQLKQVSDQTAQIELTDGNDLDKMDEDLTAAFNKIYDPTQEEFVYENNRIFYIKLLKYTAQYAQSLTYDFKKLKKAGLCIATSADGKFRIYSWDTKTGGSMRFFEAIAQYQGTDKVFSKSMKYPNVAEGEDPIPGKYYPRVFTLDASGVKAYLVNYMSIFSSSEYAEGVNLFRIEDNTLNDTLKLIKTKTGIRNDLRVDYDFFYKIDRFGYIDLIQYDSLSNTLSIPLVNEKFQVTDKRIRYKFTGQYFEKQ